MNLFVKYLKDMKNLKLIILILNIHLDIKRLIIISYLLIKQFGIKVNGDRLEIYLLNEKFPAYLQRG